MANQTNAPRSIEFTESSLPGCYTVHFPVAEDFRGNFIKTMQRSVFESRGLEADFRECFSSTSHTGVLRGMHFQLPPSDHAKLVYCTEGSICDVALDLRVGSPAYGQHASFELCAQQPTAVYLPRGLAHGFVVRTGPAVMVYHVTTEHDPARDTGIRWDTFSMPWPVEQPILSARDSGFPALADFDSPFLYRA